MTAEFWACKMHIRDVNVFVASYVWAGRVLDIDDLMGCWAYLAVSGLRFSREGISRGLGDGLGYDGWVMCHFGS